VNKIIVFLLLLILVLINCGAGRKGGNIPDGPVSSTVILSGSHSLANTYEVKLVTNKAEWEKTWKIAKGIEDPLPNIPTVDFKRQYVIAAFMGERNSSGFKIEIPAIEKKGQTLRIHVKKYETPGMLPVITNPFTLVRIPKGNFKLEVIEETVQ
jgi:hypothetical protein